MDPVLIFTCSILLILLLLIFYNNHQLNYWKRKNVPYVKPLPLVGNVLDACLLRKQMGELIKDLYDRQNAHFFGMYIFTLPYLVIKSPELIKSILTKDFRHFRNRSVCAFSEYDPIWANFLVTVKDSKWKALRAKMTTIFSTAKLRNMIKFMNEVGDDLQNHLIKYTGSQTDLIETKQVYNKYTCDVIASCAFGVNSNCFEIKNGPIEEAGRDIFGTKIHIALQQTCHFFFPSIVKLFKLRFIEQHVVDVLGEMFWRTMKEREQNSVKRNDLIDILMELREQDKIKGTTKLDDVQMLGVAINFFAGGFETTSTTMTFALYEIALNPDVQQKVRDEIKLNVEQNCELTYEVLLSMNYLDMVISESMRKYPILTFLDRVCNEEYKIPGTDVILEKGVPILIPVYGLHRDPQHYPNPETFDPERFSKENEESRHPYTNLPFGQGPRFCIGERFGLLSTKIGIIKILSEFIVERCEKTPAKVQLNPITFLTNPKNGIVLKFVHCPIFAPKK